jgi:peptidoglycan/xylan/chitin deacetylase (PgdA/CDA1 family)
MSARLFLRNAFPVVTRYSGISHALARRYRGLGTIFMLHSIVDDPSDYPDESVRYSTGKLEWTLCWLKAEGIEFVSLDQVVERLREPSSPPFAAFTFDDGYADTLTHALPVMERFAAPFTVYVTSEMVSRDIDAWWLGLAALLRAQDSVELPDLGLRWDCANLASKKRAYMTIESMIHKNYEVLPHVRTAIKAGGIDCRALVDREALSTDQLRQLARHPLVTIGAHTVTHRNLAQAPAAAVEWEIAANRNFLQETIGKPIKHLAFPFGNERACGVREARIAASMRFRTAVTTRRGSIFPQHLQHLHALPREPLTRDDTPTKLRAKINGLYRALHSQLGDPIARM